VPFPDPTQRPRFTGIAMMLAAVLPLVAASCGEETAPDDVIREVGVVEGYVLAAGTGIAAEVEARRLGDGQTQVTGTADADSTGWYRLELPAGRYRLTTHDEISNLYIQDSGWDTVQVDPAVLRHDLRRARAEIGIGMPAHLEGSHFELSLESHSFSTIDANAYVRAGRLDFVLPGLPAGSFTMQLNDLGSIGDDFYLPGVFTEGDADTLHVVSGGAATYSCDFSLTHATVSGRVTGSWQAAAAYAPYVRAYVDESQMAAVTYCQADGSYSLRFLFPVDVRLEFAHDQITQWYEGDSYANARVFALQPGDHVSGIDVVESGMEVRLEGPGDLAERNVDVLIRDESGREFTPGHMEDNPFAICNLRPGRYYLYVGGACTRQVWAGQWYGGSETPESAAPIDLGVGELRRLEFALTTGGRLAGVFEGAEDEFDWVDFRLCDALGEPLCADWFYAYGGTFEVSGLADGAYLLATRNYGSAYWWYPGTFDLSQAAAVEIVDHGTVAGLVWTMPDDPNKERR
jgi:hypothetical protein